MTDPRKNILNRVMRYGVWHGRGYSNGWNTRVRRFTDTEKSAPGVDSYDNFVAKAHDLNEIIAEELLRKRLAAAGFEKMNEVSINGTWSFQLQQTKNGRVLDFDHYLARAQTPEAKRKVADAFMLYENHFMQSNLQYAIDMDANKPNLARFGGAAARVSAQRTFAPHIFLTEAARSSERIEKISRHASPDIDRRVRADLKAHFVSPGFDNENSRFIQEAKGITFKRSLPAEAVIAAPRQDLLTAYGKIQKRALRTGSEEIEPGYDPDEHRLPTFDLDALDQEGAAASRPTPPRRDTPDRRPEAAARRPAGILAVYAEPRKTVEPGTAAADATPVTVVAPDRAAPGGLKAVTMPANTRVKDRNGDWTTVQGAMAKEGLELDPEWGAFRAPGAPDRDLRWYDWRESGLEMDPTLILDTSPKRWFWPPLHDAGKKRRATAPTRRRDG